MNPPKAFGYVRVSTDDQDVQQQQEYVASYYHSHLKDTHLWGGFYIDEGVSAYSTSWLERPGGRAMWSQLGVGDAIIIMRLDRAIRGSKDAANCWQHLESKSIDLHCVDGGRQMGGASGRFVYQIHSAVSELSSGLTSDRTKEQKRAALLRGEATEGTPKPGYKLVRSGEKRKTTGRWISMLVPNVTERKIIAAALEDFKNQRTLADIADAIACAGILRSNKGRYHLNFLSWAMHCCVLGWPLAFPRIEYLRYSREARALGITIGRNRRFQLLSSLANCERLMNEGYDFSTRLLGHPYIPAPSKRIT